MGSELEPDEDRVVVLRKHNATVYRTRDNDQLEEVTFEAAYTPETFFQLCSVRKRHFLNNPHVPRIIQFGLGSDFKGGLCGQGRSCFKVLFERVPDTLSKGLFEGHFGAVAEGCLLGLEGICEFYGMGFSLRAQMVGLDNKGRPKIWHNSRFQLSEPEQLAPPDCSLSHQEDRLIRQLLLLLVRKFPSEAILHNYLVADNSLLTFKSAGRLVRTLSGARGGGRPEESRPTETLVLRAGRGGRPRRVGGWVPEFE